MTHINPMKIAQTSRKSSVNLFNSIRMLKSWVDLSPCIYLSKKGKLVTINQIRWNNSFRIARGFVDIFEFNLTGISLWALSTICTTLLVVHMELVEYFTYSDIVSSINIHFLFSASRLWKFYGIESTNNIDAMAFYDHFLVLWIRGKSHRSLWCSWQSGLRIWLVFVPIGCSKNAAHGYDGHPTTGFNQRIWKHSLC